MMPDHGRLRGVRAAQGRRAHGGHPGDLPHRQDRGRGRAAGFEPAPSTTSPSRSARRSRWRASAPTCALKAAARLPRGQECVPREEVARRTREVRRSQDATMMRWLAGRDARQRDREPHPAHAALRARRWPRSCATSDVLACSTDEDRSNMLLQIGAAARHRQGRHPRPHPAQAGQAHARGVRDHEDPHRARARRHRAGGIAPRSVRTVPALAKEIAARTRKNGTGRAIRRPRGRGDPSRRA